MYLNAKPAPSSKILPQTISIKVAKSALQLYTCTNITCFIFLLPLPTVQKPINKNLDINCDTKRQVRGDDRTLMSNEQITPTSLLPLV